MYNTLGIDTPDVMVIDNPVYYAMPYGYRGFMNVFFIAFFVLSFVLGFVLNRKGIKEYGKLIKCTGYGTDFTDKFGMPLCMINIAVYGMLILAYLNIVFVIPEIFPAVPAGVGFTGASVGVVFAALTFASDGQHPRNRRRPTHR